MEHPDGQDPHGDHPDARQTDDTLANRGAANDDGVGFPDLGLRTELLAALDGLGYEEPTPIQRETIPPLIDGHDLLGQAATGTGKTAAFALPILQRLGEHRGTRNAPSALVLVPTRELAMQVSEAIFNYGRHLHDGKGVRVVPIYGGQPIHRQFQQLERGVDVVVATPGRAVDHIGRGSLPLDEVRMVVLDEADEMLDMGFADDLEAILGATPDERQTVLFSATLPPRINSIAKKYQRDPIRIRVAKGEDAASSSTIHQRAYVVHRSHKAAALGRILDMESPAATIVFCRTRGEVDQLTVTMNGRGYRAEALHGGMDQLQRDRVMARLRDGTAELLIATDVAARGLDVDTLTHVVNYDVPSAADSYVHRIGRVGRAGRDGVAITLAEPKEQRQLANIERLTKQRIELAAVPSVADLRDQRVAQTSAALTAALERDDLDDLATVIDGLAAEHDLRDIALAALALAHDALAPGDDDDVEIPDARRADRTPRDERPRRARDGGFDDRARDNVEQTGFLHISLGRRAGVRPGDLVGAIANEVDLPGRQIGPIRIADQYSVVGVPERAVETAIRVLDGALIRGKPAKVRRFVEHADGDQRSRRPERTPHRKGQRSGGSSGNGR
jgi:ATP-dependent RNA helicase DeaD